MITCGASHAQDSFRFSDALQGSVSHAACGFFNASEAAEFSVPSKHFNTHLHEMSFVKAVTCAQLPPSRSGFQGPGGGSLWETQLRPPVRLKLSGAVNPKSASLGSCVPAWKCGLGPWQDLETFPEGDPLA